MSAKTKSQPVVGNVLPLTESSRELLRLMNFGSIPEEAKYIAFFPDGSAQFLSEFRRAPLALNVPSFQMCHIYKDVQFLLEES